MIASIPERSASRIEYPRNGRIRKSGRTHRRTSTPQKRETGNFRHGQGRANSYEYCYYLLFDRHSFRLSASQRGTTRRLGYSAGKRPVAAHFQFGQDARNCRVDTIGAQPESPAEVYRYYGKSGQSAGAGIGCMPQHGKPQGGLHTGHDSYHFHNGNDRYRRYSGRADHAENRIYH